METIPSPANRCAPKIHTVPHQLPGLSVIKPSSHQQGAVPDSSNWLVINNLTQAPSVFRNSSSLKELGYFHP